MFGDQSFARRQRYRILFAAGRIVVHAYLPYNAFKGLVDGILLEMFTEFVCKDKIPFIVPRRTGFLYLWNMKYLI